MLAPAYGKHVYALVVITAIRDDTVYAPIVESVKRDEKEQLAKAIRQERTLATRLLQHTIGGKTAPWDETTSPLASSRCRVLGRSPTGQELDALHISSGKKRESSGEAFTNACRGTFAPQSH